MGGGGGGGGGRSEGRSLDALSFDMQHDHVLKKLSFNLLTLRDGGGEGSVGKNSEYDQEIPQSQTADKVFATMLLHS